MKTLLVKNGIIVSREYGENKKGDILIKDGVIEKIAEQIDFEADKTIDAQGKMIMPGFIDMYCKICEGGYENKKNISMVGQSAAAGGFTTLTISPNTQPIVDNKTVVEYVYSKTKTQTKVNIFPYGSITKGCDGNEIAEIGEMVKADVVALSDGGTSISNAGLLRDVLTYSKMLDVSVSTMCSDSTIQNGGIVNDGYMSTKLGLEGIPAAAEEIIVARNIVLAKHTGARLHLSHITTAGSVALIRNAKATGAKITCSTCPHYFSLTDEELENYNTAAKVFPPLRTKDDVEAVLKGIKDGTIDAVASGHTPASIERKQTEFGSAAYGVSSLETAFAVICTYLLDNTFTIYDVSDILTKNPAHILNLDKKMYLKDSDGIKNIIWRRGKLKEGYAGDIVIADPYKEWIVNPDIFYSKARYSPYNGKKLKGKIYATIVNGEEISLPNLDK